VEYCLNKKLIIYLFTLVLCLIGLFSLFQIRIEPSPPVNKNGISIEIFYPGANAETVDKQVTSQVVQGLQGINNVQYISARSQAGKAYIEMKLNDISKNQLLQTQIDIMEAIQAAHLPSSVSQPQVKVAMSASGLIQFMIKSRKHGLFEISNFVERTLAPYFNTISGVSFNSQNLDPAINIGLNPAQLAKYHLNPLSIADEVNSNYQSAPLGSLFIHGQDYILNTSDNYSTLAQLKDLTIGYNKAANLSEP
jgi:multidrug efflux pump